MTDGAAYRRARQAIEGSRILTDADKRLAHLFLGLNRRGDGCYMKPGTVAARLGWSQRTVKRHRERLRMLGLVERRKARGAALRNQGSWWVLLPPAVMQAASTEDAVLELDAHLAGYLEDWVRYLPRDTRLPPKRLMHGALSADAVGAE